MICMVMQSAMIFKKVTGLLKKAFRSIDHVCRIGGDEFAIIMVEMTSDLKYTIEKKIKAVNEELGRRMKISRQFAECRSCFFGSGKSRSEYF